MFLVEGIIKPHQAIQKPGTQVSSCLLGNQSQENLLPDSGKSARCKDHEHCQSNHPKRAGISVYEYSVKHRLHHPAEGPQHGAFDAHQYHGGNQQTDVFGQEVRPQPADNDTAVHCRLIFRGGRGF